jgi:FkbM family methyltransferase
MIMSQFGADKWVLKNNPETGFYVDLGCHDGEDLSNTKELDERGWKGICIDPFPCNFEKRTGKVVKACVYSFPDLEIIFDYSKDSPALSGISDTLGIHKNHMYMNTTIEKHKFKTRTLESILDEHDAPKNIEYLNIDIEGAEFEVLRTFPFHKYSFKLITCEHNFENTKRNMIHALLHMKGYVRVNKEENEDDWYVNTKWDK